MNSSARQKELFHMEMAKLLQAGFGIRKASEVMEDTRLPADQVRLLDQLNEGLDAGRSIKDSLAGHVSELELSIIGAGERGGRLAPAFQHLSEYFGMLASVRAEIIKSMIYPAVMLHMGVFIGTVPMALMSGEKSAGQILGNLVITLLILYTAVAVVFLVGRAIVSLAPENPAIDRWLNVIPWIGKSRANMAMARFTKVYHSCLLAGIPMMETVKTAAHAARSGQIKVASKALEKTLSGGNPLGPEFAAQRVFPKAFSRSYATGEQAGTLDTDMDQWAKRFQEQAESSAKTAAAMVPRVLYFFILMFVAWKIISFFQGYYSGMLEQFDE